MDRIDNLLDIARRVSMGEIPPYQHNELYTAGAFDGLIVHVRDGEALKLITELCARFSSERLRADDMRGYYQLLTQLARQSNTTEMPPGMADIIASEPNLSRGLSTWYRAA